MKKILWKRQITDKETNKIVDILLADRNISEKERSKFFNAPYPATYTLEDFGISKGISHHAFSIIAEAIEKKLPIIVWCDYDSDGLTGGTILWETLHALGAKCQPYISDRVTEGYGFSFIGIDELKKTVNPHLIISVDHGISGKEQIDHAVEHGIKVIVTDHHHKQEAKIPHSAESIIHTSEICGSAVSYYFSKDLVQYMVDHETNGDLQMKYKQILPHFSGDFLALAAIGTIADLVPLRNFSRSIVKWGLSKISESRKPGILALRNVSGVKKEISDVYEVGFLLSPRLNAVGRLRRATDALRLLCTRDPDRAVALAQEINSLNTTRQDQVKTALKQCEEIVERLYKDGLPKILLIHQDLAPGESEIQYWGEGIIGLVAASISQKYYRPSIIMTRTHDGYKASARSISGVNLFEMLEKCSQYLTHFGGHAMAAGLQLKTENLPHFQELLFELSEKDIADDLLIAKVTCDIHLPLSAITIELAQAIGSLEPFGMGFPKPVFASRVKIVDKKRIGKDKSHISLQVAELEKNEKLNPIEMLGFGWREQWDSLIIGNAYTIAYKIEADTWNGTTRVKGFLESVVTIDAM